MKPFIRFLKLTCVVEIFCEDGKWIAKSDSLGMEASGESPEDAMDELQRELQSAENDAARKRKADAAKKSKEVAKKSAEKVEQTVEDSDTEFDDPEEDAGEGSAVTLELLESEDVAGLREIASKNGIESEGLTKAPLREKLIKELIDES